GVDETVWPPNSYNNEVGVPLPALRAVESTRFLALAVGARSIGNLPHLTNRLRPHIAVDLAGGTAHSALLRSIEHTARAKAELVESLTAGSTAVLNADDPRVAGMRDVLAAEVETLWFSQRESLPEWVGQTDAIVRGTGVSTDASGHPTFTLSLPGEEPQDVRLALIGDHHVGNALAAAAIAHACGVGMKPIVTTLSTSSAASRWRMELIDSPSGVTVLNDAYNANPESMRASLKTL